MIDTHWLAMKGLYPQDEVSNLQDLPVKVETILLHVPYLQAERHLVVMKVGKLSL
jgi:16S rRNA (guanine527-N7)-methyltransferase